jgi:hypothetical protein
MPLPGLRHMPKVKCLSINAFVDRKAEQLIEDGSNVPIDIAKLHVE